MKKYLFFAVAALAMTGCSQDEVMEVAQKEAISFKDAFVENATRAIDNTYSNTNKPASFLVYGNTQGNETNAPIVPIFKAVTVSSTNTTGVGDDYKYDAQYTQYWIKDNKYNFAAVVNGTVEDANIVNGLPTKINYNAGNNSDIDLLYATAAAVGKEKGQNSTVEFTFSHLLSKAMFTVKNTMTSNTADRMYTYRVSNVKINNAYPTGTYTVANNGSWEVSGTNNLVVDFGNISNAAATGASSEAVQIGKANAEDQATSHNQKVLIPTAYGETNKLSITCKIETLLNDNVINVEETHTIEYAHTFVAGHAYNFIIKIGEPGDPIMFTVKDVVDWIPATGGTDTEIETIN